MKPKCECGADGHVDETVHDRRCPVWINYAADCVDRLAEAERHREVLADALRLCVANNRAGIGDAAEGALAALRECGLLRPQDDPAMIPAAWLTGAEEDEG